MLIFPRKSAAKHSTISALHAHYPSDYLPDISYIFQLTKDIDDIFAEFTSKITF
jgi:hypothetical protein